MNEFLFDLGHFLIEIVCRCERRFQTLIISKTFVQILDLRSQVADFIHGLMELGNSIIHLHGQSELLLHGCFLSFVSRIDRQMKRSSLRFAADG